VGSPAARPRRWRKHVGELLLQNWRRQIGILAAKGSSRNNSSGSLARGRQGHPPALASARVGGIASARLTGRCSSCSPTRLPRSARGRERSEKLTWRPRFRWGKEVVVLRHQAIRRRRNGSPDGRPLRIDSVRPFEGRSARWRALRPARPAQQLALGPPPKPPAPQAGGSGCQRRSAGESHQGPQRAAPSSLEGALGGRALRRPCWTGDFPFPSASPNQPGSCIRRLPCGVGRAGPQGRSASTWLAGVEQQHQAVSRPGPAGYRRLHMQQKIASGSRLH